MEVTSNRLCELECIMWCICDVSSVMTFHSFNWLNVIFLWAVEDMNGYGSIKIDTWLEGKLEKKRDRFDPPVFKTMHTEYNKDVIKITFCMEHWYTERVCET